MIPVSILGYGKSRGRRQDEYPIPELKKNKVELGIALKQWIAPEPFVTKQLKV